MCPDPAPESAPIGRLCVFGAYSDHDLYQRNRVLVEQLSLLSSSVAIVRPSSGRERHSFAVSVPLPRRMLSLAGDLWWLWRRRARLDDADVVFVPYPPVAVLLLLRVCRWRRRARAGHVKLVADAFLELHDTLVEDRRLLRAGSLADRSLLWLQRATIGHADLVLIDTPPQAAVLRERLGDSASHVAPVPVGIDEGQWRALPQPPPESSITVLFWGTFIPLHGVRTILEAARILQASGAAIRFRLVGDGQTAPETEAALREQPLSNLVWERTLLDTRALLQRASQAHVLLGAFGDSRKAANVIPYKVHQGLALNRPVITRRTSALASLENHERGLFLVDAADPVDLAAAIERTAVKLRQGWMPATAAIYAGNFSTDAVRRALREALEL